MLVGGEPQIGEFLVEGGVLFLGLLAHLVLGEADMAGFRVCEEEAVHEAVFGAGTQFAEHGGLYAAEEGDEGFGEDHGLAHAALAVHYHFVCRPEVEPVLPIGTFAALVLVHASHPSCELVAVDQKAAGVVFEDGDEGLDGGVRGHAASHRRDCWFFRGWLACLLGLAFLNLPFADLALPFVLIFRVGFAQLALALEGRLLGDLGRGCLHRTRGGDHGHKQGRPLAPAALDLDNTAGADRAAEGR